MPTRDAIMSADFGFPLDKRGTDVLGIKNVFRNCGWAVSGTQFLATAWRRMTKCKKDAYKSLVLTTFRRRPAAPSSKG